MTRPADIAAHVHAQLRDVPACEAVRVFVNILTGTLYDLPAQSDIADTLEHRRDILIIGTYTRESTRGQIFADVLQGIADATVMLAAAPFIHYTPRLSYDDIETGF
jgi:hypothetical protein